MAVSYGVSIVGSGSWVELDPIHMTVQKSARRYFACSIRATASPDWALSKIERRFVTSSAFPDPSDWEESIAEYDGTCRLSCSCGGYPEDPETNGTLQVRITFVSSPRPRWQIDTSVSPEGCGTVTGGGVAYLKSETPTIRLTATPAQGYKLDHWESDTGVILSTSNPYDQSQSAGASYVDQNNVYHKLTKAVFVAGDEILSDSADGRILCDPTTGEILIG